eukprot:CAMPEP_0113255864 /NCGR_PEP_ID=MMETSP0008_2-20120614/14458_1 /TAXON_ID=97485 /ORGANISM="Prymnesium parvum" /LENGTH=100 /DNA_ID=CAMNT_0000104169 /DNA_START=674 /DNA_END=973 /DNA_ORIENTATION=+ /assembly_acc=CAM_ASM_000153
MRRPHHAPLRDVRRRPERAGAGAPLRVRRDPWRIGRGARQVPLVSHQLHLTRPRARPDRSFTRAKRLPRGLPQQAWGVLGRARDLRCERELAVVVHPASR